MSPRDKMLAVHETVLDRMETEREIVADMDEVDIEEMIDGECSQCGSDYYSVDLVEGLCLKCFATRD